MNSSWFSRTNEKLHFASLLLAHLDQLAGEKNLTGRASRHALSESFVFQLQGALHAFCNEVAKSIGEAPVANLAELEAVCQRRGSDLEAVRELLLLQTRPGSWLNGLQEAWALCWKPREVPDREAATGIGGIVVCVETGASLPDSETCRAWLAAMKETIEHLRLGLEEW